MSIEDNKYPGIVTKINKTSHITFKLKETSSTNCFRIITINESYLHTRQQDFGTRMNPFALNLTCVTMHKSEKISFRGRQNFSTENQQSLRKKFIYTYLAI
jgi:hypothetical protein